MPLPGQLQVKLCSWALEPQGVEASLCVGVLSLCVQQSASRRELATDAFKPLCVFGCFLGFSLISEA